MQSDQTIQSDLTFNLNVFALSSIHFAEFSIVPAKENVVTFT